MSAIKPLHVFLFHQGVLICSSNIYTERWKLTEYIKIIKVNDLFSLVWVLNFFHSWVKIFFYIQIINIIYTFINKQRQSVWKNSYFIINNILVFSLHHWILKYRHSNISNWSQFEDLKIVSKLSKIVWIQIIFYGTSQLSI